MLKLQCAICKKGSFEVVCLVKARRGGKMLCTRCAGRRPAEVAAIFNPDGKAADRCQSPVTFKRRGVV